MFDKKKIEKTFWNKVAISLNDSEKLDERNKNFIDSVKETMNSWNFEDLEEFYEQGLRDNCTFLSNEIWSIAVGYALIMRYGLEDNEYVEWAKKQKTEFAFELLNLIGVEDESLKLKIEKQREKSTKIENNKEKYTYFSSLLKKYHQFIKISTNTTEWCLFGKYFLINDNTIFAGKVYSCLELAEKFAIETFDNELENCCTDYVSCIENLETVLNDALHAFWSKVKRTLKNEKVSEEIISNIKQLFFENVKSLYVKKGFDEEYFKMYQELKNQFNDFNDEYQDKLSRRFYGGGVGISGAIKGSIGADILSGLNYVVSNVGTTGKATIAKRKFEQCANEFYLGKDSINVYHGSLKDDFSILYQIINHEIFDDQISLQSEFNNIYYELEKYRLIFSAKEINELASLVIQTFPFNQLTYKFLQEVYVNAYCFLHNFAKKIGIIDLLREHKSQLISFSCREILFYDLEIKSNTNSLSICNIEYDGVPYNITVPNIDISFEKINCVKRIDDMSNNIAITDQKDQIYIRIWGGKEGKNKFWEEVSYNENELLEKIDNWNNISIKDYSQNPIWEKNDKYYKYIFECIFENKYNAYLLMYADIEEYICICISSLDGTTNVETLIKSVDISQVPITSLKLQTIAEVQNQIINSKRTQMIESLKLIKDSSYTVQKLLFRKRFKALLENTIYENNSVNLYCFEIQDDSLKYLISELGEKFDSYVLYFSENIIITDNNIYIFDEEKQTKKIHMSDVKEVVIATTYLMEALPRIFFIMNNDTLIICDINDKELKNELVYIADIINISLDLRYTDDKDRKYKEAQGFSKKQYIICEKCKKIAPVRVSSGTIFNNFSCGNCGASRDYINKIVINSKFKDIISSLDFKIENAEKTELFSEENNLLKIMNVENISALNKKMDNIKRKKEAFDYELDNCILPPDKIAVLRYLLTCALRKFGDKTCLVEKYAYELSNEYLAYFFENKRNKSEFVIYHKNALIVTDQSIYFETSNKLFECSLAHLTEIITMYKAYNEKVCTALLFRTNSGDLLYDNKDRIYQLTEIYYINMCLEIAEQLLDTISSERYYYRIKSSEDKNYVYCSSCGKFTTFTVRSVSFFNSISCDACNCDPAQKGHFEILACENVDSKRNSLKAIIPRTLQEILDFAYKHDNSIDGILTKYKQEREVCEHTVKDKDEREEYEARKSTLSRKNEEKTVKDELEKSKKMFCPYCGKQIFRTAKFCNFCGKANSYNK